MCEYFVVDYLQLSQIGKVVKSFNIDGGQLVVAEISEKTQRSKYNYVPTIKIAAAPATFFITFIVSARAIFQ